MLYALFPSTLANTENGGSDHRRDLPCAVDVHHDPANVPNDLTRDAKRHCDQERPGFGSDSKP